MINFTAQLLLTRKSTTVLHSRFRAIDFGFQVLDSGLCQAELGFRVESGFLYMGT